ncbi:MAG: CotH kinase family protein [Bacteroidales bacterium]|nr:CotH kinase family protein [Bacteroidales bacterium]
MREILYQDLISKYIPTTKGNFVKLYVNNEYFGLYSNIQQIDNVLIKEWFLSNDGSRWRAYVKSGFPMGSGRPGGPGGPMGGPGRPGRPSGSGGKEDPDEDSDDGPGGGMWGQG